MLGGADDESVDCGAAAAAVGCGYQAGDAAAGQENHLAHSNVVVVVVAAVDIGLVR